MVSSIHQPQRKDPLDTILKGLAVANSVYGIKDRMDAAGAREAQLKRLAEQDAVVAEDRTRKVEEQDRLQSNRINVREQANLAQQGFEQVDENTPGAISFVGPDNAPLFLKKKQAPAMTPYQQAQLDLSRQRSARQELKDDESREKTKNESVRKLVNSIDKSGLAESIQAIKKIDSFVDIDGDSDIPGVGGFSNLGKGPLETFLSDEGKKVRQSIAGFRNIILKARSGGAVTPAEADRMLEELGEGVFRTDAQLRQGLKNARDVFQAKLGLLESSVDQDVLAEYSSRNNALTTSDSLFNPDPSSRDLPAEGTAMASDAGDTVRSSIPKTEELSDEELDRQIKELEKSIAN